MPFYEATKISKKTGKRNKNRNDLPLVLKAIEVRLFSLSIYYIALPYSLTIISTLFQQ